MSKNDGGPAFPITQEGAIEVILERGHSPEGMTMRQYYKAAALQGMVAGFQREAVDIVLTENWEERNC